MQRGLGRLVPSDYGRYIYAYCHIRTNQVVYSLTQRLKNYRALQQLPDLGANNKDAVLRKDMWKPLWTLCLPGGDDARSQGLAAFQKLREWRKLHELNWEVPESLKMPYTEEYIEERYQARLENRGGSKTEHPHDLVKRTKKRMRVRLVQNQKANSIADLAAVLMEQEDMGEKIAKWQADANARDRALEVEHMRELAKEAKNGGILKLHDGIRAFERRLEKVLAGEEDKQGFKRTRLRREIQSLELKQARMMFAFNAVTRIEREAQGEKVLSSNHSAQVKAAHKFAELARANPRDEMEDIQAKLQSIANQESSVADAEQNTQAIERAKFDHQVRLHQIQLARGRNDWTFDGNWLAAVDDLQQQLLDYKLELARSTESQEAEARVEAEAAQWRALRAEPDFVVESNLYNGSKAARAQELRYLAEIVNAGALEYIEYQIQSRQIRLERGEGPEHQAVQTLLNKFRITEHYMLLAAAAAASNPGTDMTTEADAIRTSVFEFAVRRARENLLIAQRAKKPEDIIQSLERDLAEAQQLLQETRSSGFTTAERTAADRRRRLADAVQAERASRPELFVSEPEPIEESPVVPEETTEPVREPVSEQSVEGQEAASESPEHAAADQEPPAAGEVDWISQLPSIPKRMKEPLLKTRRVRDEQRKLNAPVFSTENVTVRWQNLLDAEFAEQWPSNVTHQGMGWTRFTAPKGLEPPVEDLAQHTIMMGRRSKKYALSAPLPGSVAAEEESASHPEEDVDAEGENALEAEAEERNVVVDIAKSRILERVRELARTAVTEETKGQRYLKYVKRVERRGEVPQPIEEFSAHWKAEIPSEVGQVEGEDSTQAKAEVTGEHGQPGNEDARRV